MRKIAFLPYESNDNESIVIIRNIFRKYADVVDYALVKKGLYPLETISAYYLNWVENSWTEEDEKLLKQAKRLKKKIIWVFHNRVPHNTDNKEKAEKIIKRVIQLSDVIAVHSRESIKYLQMYDATAVNKVVYLPHVTYENVYYDYGGDIRKKYGIEKEDVVFGLFGLIRPYKNIEPLMQLFQEDALKKAKLLVVGKCTSDDYIKKLKQLQSDNVILHNKYINNLEMKSYLDAVDVLVLPYDLQSSMNSGAMIMAFTYGKTVLMPRITMSEEFPDSVMFKYEYKGQEDMYEVLREKLQEIFTMGKEQLDIMGQQAQQIITKNHSLEKVEAVIASIL